MDARNLLSLSGVLLVLGAAGFYWGMGQGTTPVLNGEEQHLPDYEVSGIQSWQTDAQGQVLRRLEAAAATHYPQPERTILTQPVITLYSEGQAAWRVSAAEAVSTQKNAQIDLQKGVLGERILAGALPVRVETASLTVFPEKESLRTDARVTIRSPNGQIQSRGLDANMKASTLNLHREVQGTYVIQAQP